MSSQKPKTNTRKTWRETLTLSRFMNGIVALIVLLSSCILAYFAFDNMYREKVKDAWALLYLEIENVSKNFSIILQSRHVSNDFVGRKSKNVNPSLATFKSVDNVNFRLESGEFQENLHLNELRLMERLKPGQFYITRMDQAILLVKNSGYYKKSQSQKFNYQLDIWKIDIEDYFPLKSTRLKHTIIYVLNRSGQLIHQNDDAIEQSKVLRRPLVKHFVESNYKQAQVEISNTKKERIYGFFFEIPDTNLVVFGETTRENALAQVRKIAIEYGQLVGGIILLSLFSLNFLLRSIRRGIRELIIYAEEISLGKFYNYEISSSFGEINILSRRFSHMSTALVARDKAIERLLVDKEKSIKLESSLEIAKNLQESFLPRKSHFNVDSIELASLYKPAEQVGGDWYQYHYFEDSKIFIVAIADVSGHGPGASMLTAVISTVFDENIEKGHDFNTQLFLSSVNSRILNFGRSKWMSTFQILKYDLSQKSLEVYNAGHTPPIFLREKTNKPMSILLPSVPLGVEKNDTFKSQKIKIEGKTQILLYTDCLVETENTKRKRFQKKKILNLILTSADASCKEGLASLYDEWSTFHRESEIKDDLCLIRLNLN